MSYDTKQYYCDVCDHGKTGHLRSWIQYLLRARICFQPNLVSQWIPSLSGDNYLFRTF